jgi:hypothetical protein
MPGCTTFMHPLAKVLAGNRNSEARLRCNYE